MNDKPPEKVIQEQAERIRQLERQLELTRAQMCFFIRYGQTVQDRELPSIPLC